MTFLCALCAQHTHFARAFSLTHTPLLFWLLPFLPSLFPSTEEMLKTNPHCSPESQLRWRHSSFPGTQGASQTRQAPAFSHPRERPLLPWLSAACTASLSLKGTGHPASRKGNSSNLIYISAVGLFFRPFSPGFLLKALNLLFCLPPHPFQTFHLVSKRGFKIEDTSGASACPNN